MKQPSQRQWLFSYGTLRDPDVQLSTFGRRLGSRPGTIVGFRLETIRIRDADFVALSGSEYHRSLVSTACNSDRVDGVVLAVTDRELALADEYEPDGYERMQARLASGAQAWVYVHVGQSQDS